MKDSDGNEFPCPNCFDPGSQIFAFYYDEDLLISGSESKYYTVEVTGVSGDISPKSVTANFELQIRNPCIDPDFVTIIEESQLN